MNTLRSRLPIIAALAAASCLVLLAVPSLSKAEGDPDKGKLLLTIFLKHDQSLTLDEINARQEKTGFRKAFPPEGVEVVSWYVMMGIGQVVTVRLPPEKLREVNRLIEQKAWGAYRTEFYPTYDFRPVVEAERHKVTAN
jgi:hypothetical protein